MDGDRCGQPNSGGQSQDQPCTESEFEHAMIPGLTMRLYLLAYGDGTLAIEVDDLAGGANLAEYTEIVDSIRFAD